MKKCCVDSKTEDQTGTSNKIIEVLFIHLHYTCSQMCFCIVTPSHASLMETTGCCADKFYTVIVHLCHHQRPGPKQWSEANAGESACRYLVVGKEISSSTDINSLAETVTFLQQRSFYWCLSTELCLQCGYHYRLAFNNNLFHWAMTYSYALVYMMYLRHI